MREVAKELTQKYSFLLEAQRIAKEERWQFQKWLRYYVDFCGKYHFSSEERGSLLQFLKKLREKRQTGDQLLQASRAIELY
jgi:predicted solute-binding protein